MERLGVDAVLTDDHTVIRSVNRLYSPAWESKTLPWPTCRAGMVGLIRSLTQPVLGICLGMQRCSASIPKNDTPCLGIIPQKVLRFRPANGRKVPTRRVEQRLRPAKRRFLLSWRAITFTSSTAIMPVVACIPRRLPITFCRSVPVYKRQLLRCNSTRKSRARWGGDTEELLNL